MKYRVTWFDAENHTMDFSNWDKVQAVLKRLVLCGLKPTVESI
jgi:hypothetical protein